MKSKKSLRIIAGIAAALLIGTILFLSNAFVGNPISAMMAGRAASKYAMEKYPSLDLELERPKYNLKDSSYHITARSKNSMDTHFSIYYRSGKVTGDNYSSNVQGKMNTLDRLSREYSELVKSLVADKMGYEKNTSMVMYSKENYERPNSMIELDMKFDRSLPLEAEVLLRLDISDNSLSNISKILVDAHRIFVENECIFSKYDLYSETNGTLVMINNVTPQDIESGELERLLQEAKDNKGTSGISVLIKGEKN